MFAKYGCSKYEKVEKNLKRCNRHKNATYARCVRAVSAL